MRRFLRQLRRSKAARMARAAQKRLAARRPRLGTAGASPWLRRGVLVGALLAVALVPYPVLADQPGAAACHHGCHGPAQLNPQRWTAPLPGAWTVDSGMAGTSPAAGQAYVAVGSGIAAVGDGLAVAAFTENGGKPIWQQELTGFPSGAQITSVRTWPDEVTVGVVAGAKRTEVVFDGATGAVTGQYPSALYGGAVGGSGRYTVIIGPDAVTSYDNRTGKKLWHQAVRTVQQAWRSDGQYLYLAESRSGYLSGAPVTGLLRIDIATGAEQRLVPWNSTMFAGSLAAAFGSVVLFTSASGTTAYDGTTGLTLWSAPGTVPFGSDPQRHRIYLSRGSGLISVLPQTGRVDSTVSGVSGGTYVIRDGIALGMDLGAEGAAWGYDVAAQRVALAASGLGWPHYFSDLSGVGGSADPTGTMVVIAACAAAGPAPAVSGSGPAGSASPGSPPPGSASSGSASAGSGLASPPPSSSPAVSSPSPSTAQPCTQPELVGLAL